MRIVADKGTPVAWGETVRRVAAGRLLVTAAVLSTSAGPALAQDFEALGTRALGMAGAFVAVADDATAAYWNPAGLVTGAFMSLLLDYQQTERWLDPTRADTPATGRFGHLRRAVDQLGGVFVLPLACQSDSEVVSP